MRRILAGAGLVFAFILIMLFIYPRYGWLYAGLLMLIVTFMVVRAYSMGYRYICANCGTVFRVPVPVDFLTFSGMGKNPDGTYHTWKSLTCPSCGQRTKAVAVKVRYDESDPAAADRYRSRGAGDGPAAPAARPRSTKSRAARKRK